MLKAGFDGRPDAFAALEGVHSVKRIGTPKEVAQAALFLASPEAGFISGGTIYQDGGILSRLHDPI
jgi:NAD(P)-dependent dehydrogenase (short-subunit alcohol dehydrogenase family)